MGILTDNSTTYSRVYENFRGVDFSSDHTQVQHNRLAYLVNMYRDYQSGQGQALETVPGFRRRFVLADESKIHGIFYFKHKSGSDTLTKVLVHAGTKLWLWHNYPNTINIEQTGSITVPTATSTIEGVSTYNQELSFTAASVTYLGTQDGTDLTSGMTFDAEENAIEYLSSSLEVGQTLIIKYYEGLINTSTDTPLFATMNERKSEAFVFNNMLYIIDGKNYLVYDGTTLKEVTTVAYIPTTYINIIPTGDNANIGTEYEQRNILQPEFKHTFVADGTNMEFALNENQLDSIVSVTAYGVAVTAYTADLANGKVTFTTPPAAPEDTIMVASTETTAAVYYPEMYAGIEIKASKAISISLQDTTVGSASVTNIIKKCTLVTTFDGKVFMSGNPDYPNNIFYTEKHDGYEDATYFGILNYVKDGVGLAPITGLLGVSDTLMVLKSDTQQDSAIYFHKGADSGIPLSPRIYPAAQGLSGLGCVGACVNFLDDPIFVSRLGIEAVGQLSVRLERANEHRSSLIDAKLVNNDLSKALLEEWNGYLCVLIDGKIFLADSRQVYQHAIGVPQYEWYYIEGVGVWKNQYKEYRYANDLEYSLVIEQEKTIEYEGEELPLELANAVYFSDENITRNLIGEIANVPDADGNTTATIINGSVMLDINDTEYERGISYKIHEILDQDTGEVAERHAYLCTEKGNYTGGKFKPASVIKSMDDNLFFGTENGVVCSFNFDMRDDDGEVPTQYYSFDDRTIISGCATVMDNCDIPHLAKSTIKRSTVIKTKSFRNSAAKIKIRTNNKPYEQIARINNSLFSFEDMDFTDFTFSTMEQSLYAIKEKEKHWVEKQYYVYSDEYRRPFALYYISYRYKVAGRYKN